MPFVVPGLSASSSTTPTPSSSTSSSQDPVFDVRRYAENPVTERRSYRGTRCMDQQKPNTKIKMKDAKKYTAIYCMTCRTGCRISVKLWSMKVVFQSHQETLRQRSKTLPDLLMNYLLSREQKWNQARASTVSTLTFRRSPIVISA